MYHIFLIHSFVDGHLGCFNVLAIVNNAVKHGACQSRFLYKEKKIYDKTHLENTTDHSFS